MKFRNQILKYCMIIAVITELVSLLIEGPDIKFFCGLAVGTAVTMFNFGILALSAVKLTEKHSKAPVVAGYFIRLPIYGAAFYFCLMAGKMSAIGCVLGFVTLHIAIMYIYGIKSRLPGADKNPLNDWKEPKQWNDLSQWDDEDDDWGPLPGWPKKNRKK